MSAHERFRLKRHYSVVGHGPDNVELRYGVWNPVSFTLLDEEERGRLFALVSRLEEGGTVDELARAEGVPRDEVEELVDHLAGLGVLAAGPTDALEHYLDTAAPARSPDEAPPERPVVLLGDEQLTGEIRRHLEEVLEVPVLAPDPDDPAWRAAASPDTAWLSDGLLFEERLPVFEPWSGAFVVFASRVVNPVQLQVVNRVCLALRVPWLHAALDGPLVLVGPTIVPHRSPCYECLEGRVLMNLREGASYQGYKNALLARQVSGARFPLQSSLASLLAAHVAMEVVNFSLTGSAVTVGKLLALYLPTMEFSYNEVLRLPGCPGCAPVAERDDTQLYFDIGAVLGGRTAQPV